MTIPPSPTTSAAPDGADPSMEEILASIRRILNDDEAPAVPPAEPASPEEAVEEDDVLILDDSMIVPEDELEPAVAVAMPAADLDEFDPPTPEPWAAEPAIREAVAEPSPPEPPEPEIVPVAVFLPAEAMGLPALTPELLAPEAAAATASSVDNLVRTLAANRSTQVYGGGPTLEDMVRAELRPLLKEWLDANLPPMVERLVRIEIERVVGRSVP